MPYLTFPHPCLVQLPDELPVLKQTKFATPVIFAERRGREQSGWVHYLTREHKQMVGTSARVTIGANGLALGA